MGERDSRALKRIASTPPEEGTTLRMANVNRFRRRVAFTPPEEARRVAGGPSEASDHRNANGVGSRPRQGSGTMLAMPSTHTSLHIHIVFSTKGRVPLIDAAWRSDLHAYIGGCLKRLDAFPQEIGGVADHVHLLIGIKPVHAIADLVKETKRASTEWVRESKHVRGFAWQEGYGAFSVSKSAVLSVREYIQ